MKRFIIGAAVLFLAVAPVFASPAFPPLTGRVVDNANILSPAVEKELTDKLAQLEAGKGHQLVVATFPTLQGYEIEDFGYQLGRRWGIGSKEDDNGALFIVAPKERKVRIEVGYGLEPVLTDALSSVILQTAVVPRFKAGDMEGGVVDGTDAIIAQLGAPPEQALAVAQEAARDTRDSGLSLWPFAPFFPILCFFILFMVLRVLTRGGRRRGGGLGGVLPWIILGALSDASRSRGGGWSGGGGGGWSSGGGGFSGGGGSFGGGGSSGSW